MSENSNAYTPGQVSPYDGMVWDGHKWTGTPTPGATATRAQGRGPETTQTQLLRSLVYGVMAIVVGVWATFAIPMLGREMGSLVALGCAVMSIVFAILCLVKIPPKS